MSLAMIRSLFLFFAVFVCALGVRPARAQTSDADLVTRIGRLEATIRELTGNVEQLQYRNQQLEQQVQRLQDEAAQEGRGPARSSSVPPQQRPSIRKTGHHRRAKFMRRNSPMKSWRPTLN